MSNFAKKLLIVAGSVTLAGILAVAMVPKAAHAVAAALVQVTNTTANPVPNLDVNTAAEEPLEAILCFDSGNGECAALPLPNFFVVPTTTTDGLSVKRAVIEDLSGNCGGPSVQVEGLAISTFVKENIVTASQAAAAVAISPQTGNNFVIFGQPIRLYADAGAEIGMVPYVSGGGNYVCSVFLNGYLITK